MSGERERNLVPLASKIAQPTARNGKSIKDMEKRDQEEKIVKRTQGKETIRKKKETDGE